MDPEGRALIAELEAQVAQLSRIVMGLAERTDYLAADILPPVAP